MKRLSIFSFVLFTLFSVGCADAEDSSSLSRISHWSLSDDEGGFSYAISIWKGKQDLMISYSFVYEDGGRVNATVETEDFRSLTALGNDCYQSTAIDYIEAPKEEFEIIMCEREEKMFWSLLSTDNPSFVPQHAVLNKYDLSSN
ncbi:hypothetical protein [Kangiella shandongensis]|uniref:hypothetical protein n=1 Tax=Kangiella shandongensis TaxID=2763258 RepID=UPI001CBD0128|nr:hypothetical protein [Kangiella shandongensis]